MSYSYYTFQNRNLVLDNKGKKYYLSIKDLPEEEKPREKILKHGVSSLSAAELLAVILNTGTKREGVLEMSSRLIKNYGEVGMMFEKDPKKISEKFEIPLGKAMQIAASAELGRRFFQKNHSSMPVVRTAREVYDYVRDMRELSKEHLRGIYLNAHYKVIHDEVISLGTVDGSMIHPREVFKPAIERSAVAVILAHNHPSGITNPSETDLAVTKQLVKAGKLLGVDLLDHIIVTKDSFCSIPADYS